MTFQPGCRFIVAPHFHLLADWPRRLLVGAGVQEAGGCFFPQPSWRPPTTDELAVLLGAADGAVSPEELEASICLFQLPAHLGSQWWQLLEQSAELLGDGRLPGFEAFVGRVVEFLAFKDLPTPAGARCTVVVNQPGPTSLNWGPESRHPAGLGCHFAAGAPWPGEEELRWPRLWGAINLGTEETSVVLINLLCRQLEAELRRRLPGQSAPSAVDELVKQFLRSCSDYPTVRLILRPGEGFRLPSDGLILNGYAADKQGPDVLMLISHEGTRST
jgi:hypothetical protein